ncbi:MAG: murein transglycosylase A [Alphaproteobacteria bacterium]|nr:murein transglycosylase A [Alphaproteobacteria bacterium]
MRRTPPQRRLLRAAAAVLLLSLTGCPPPAPEQDRLQLAPAEFAALPGWREDRLDDALAALRRSCARLAALAPDAAVGPQALGARAGDWRPACTAADAPNADARAVFEAHFVPFAAAGKDGAEGTYTGYYEPEIAVDAARSERFATPILARPPELVTVDLGQFREEWRNRTVSGHVVDGHLRPYHTRAQIVAGALAGRGLELAWAGDPVDVFFLHIQGSGVLRFPDGRQQRVAFDGQNGYAYTAIGAELVRDGAMALADVSMQSIRAWLAAHPAEAPALMDRNRSYIFFKTVPDGPWGAANVILTPERSLAVDTAFIAYGLPVFLDIDDPRSAGARLQRLMVAQDRGGAIRGPVRGDFFWGTGAAAGEAAGLMRSRGRSWLLLPRPLAERRAG